MKKAVHIFFSGDVQGVGFRFSAQALARHYGLRGWVMNLSDGRVELLAEGSADQFKAFLDELQGRFRGHISDTLIDQIPPTSDCQSFDIRFSR